MLITTNTLVSIFRTLLQNQMIWNCAISIGCYAVGLTRSSESLQCVHTMLNDSCTPRTAPISMVCTCGIRIVLLCLKKFVVCFNNAARMFFGYDRFCSASSMYVSERIDNFGASHRKAVFDFMSRLRHSNNHIVSALLDSDLACYSSVRKTWSTALYM